MPTEAEDFRQFMMDVIERLSRMEAMLQAQASASKAEVASCRLEHNERFRCVERETKEVELTMKDVIDTQRRLGWVMAGAGLGIIADLVVHLAQGGW